ncbi:MAG TPA: MauE/DoxX family redox-associated membrane protein [Candidatus Acidoferrales bacterium]|nr:MauE/DoxX family redox-associated membrane protein [Candidatus Acidoferrales bacterium]
MAAGRILLGAVFVYAAYTKLRQDPLLFAMAIDAYKLIPEDAAVAVAHVLPWVELGLGIALMAGIFLRVTATSATALLGVFFAAMVRAYQPDLKEGQQISCGCFGLGEPISGRTLARDGTLLAVSLALTVAAFWVARRKREGEAPAAPAGAALAEKS